MDGPKDPNEKRLQELRSDVLTPIVQRALDRPTATVTTWQYRSMPGGFGGGMGGTFIYRFSGTAQDQSQALDWSLILKVMLHRPDEDPASPKYWKREYEFYKSGLFADTAGGLAAARCYGVTEYEGEACWLWLEELHDDLGKTWPLEHYRLVGQHAGHFNGTFLGNRPDEHWLSSQWLRKTIESMTSYFPAVLDSLEHALLKPVFPADARTQFERLLADHERFLAALERLPQTIAHQDYFRRNAFARRTAEGGYRTVAVDWAFVGHAAVGTDAAMPVLIGLFTANIDPKHTNDHEQLVYEGYLAGLRDMGWKGSERDVRLGYTAATALKYIELASTLPLLFDPDVHPHIEKILECRIPEYIHHAAAMNRLAHRMADEARTLL